MNDPVFDLIAAEEQRQRDTLMLIPSENYMSANVRQALGSMLSNKYAEGYPGARYYEGNRYIDQIETLAIDRATALFGVPYANVQSYSGSPANSAILFALADPGSTIMGLSLSSGGHLTHGHPRVTFSGKIYNSVQFGLGDDGRIDYDGMEKLAKEHLPKVIILGTTAYPFFLDWEKARAIADSVGAWLVADISHIAGLIIAGVHPSPVPFADVIMTTTHKTLRGPRGALILVTARGLSKDALLGKKIDSAIIPGLQGGPHNATTAGIAIALHEAATLDFQSYGKAVVENAAVLSKHLSDLDIDLVGSGTQNHLMVLDFSKNGQGSGNLIAIALDAAGIVTNRNTVPGDTSPFYPSGVRIGTPAVTTRGMGADQMRMIATWIKQIADHVSDSHLPGEKTERATYITDFRNQATADPFMQDIAKKVSSLCSQFPLSMLHLSK